MDYYDTANYKRHPLTMSRLEETCVTGHFAFDYACKWANVSRTLDRSVNNKRRLLTALCISTYIGTYIKYCSLYLMRCKTRVDLLQAGIGMESSYFPVSSVRDEMHINMYTYIMHVHLIVCATHTLVLKSIGIMRKCIV